MTLIRKLYPCFLDLCHMGPCLSICVWARAHMLRCLTIIVFPFRLNLLLSSGYQRPAFTVISAWLHHGSNHCRSGVSALAQDRNTTDWHRLQRKVILWQTVVLAGNSGYHNQEGGNGQWEERAGGLASQKRSRRQKDYLWIIRANKIKEQAQVLVCLTSVTQKRSNNNKKSVILFRPVVIPLAGETQNHVKHNGKYLRSSFINQEQLWCLMSLFVLEEEREGAIWHASDRLLERAHKKGEEWMIWEQTMLVHST